VFAVSRKQYIGKEFSWSTSKYLNSAGYIQDTRLKVNFLFWNTLNKILISQPLILDKNVFTLWWLSADNLKFRI